ncbi:MAG: ABC transporter ATP-binding protein [Bacteroidetes bacterium]|nr:ABC transporter ATP-binding protein [Bacteroidota bacterium]MBL7104744.1 ABC transporter ATP-binding protein [Bacteroidales bacterium]
MKIFINNLNFSYNGSFSLKDINEHIGAGEFTAFVGPNGSGKSTLLKCIDRILIPDNGEILFNDQDISNYSREKVAKIIAYVPQNEGNIYPVTVFDAVLLGRKPYVNWAPSKNDFDKTAEVIEKLDLEDIALKEIYKLSGGQRQRVYIARALAQEPKVLLLDEPTANLDLRHQLEVLEILKLLSEKGITIIIAIHDLNMAVKFCSKFIMLNEGEIFATGGKEIITSGNIKKLYRVKVKIINEDGEIIIIPLSNNDKPMKLALA